MQELKQKLRQAQQNFDYADDEFIDAAIYELKATEEKFAAMLREKKKERRERSEGNIRECSEGNNTRTSNVDV